MFERVRELFWKALTPDLVAEDTVASSLAELDAPIEAGIDPVLVAALGGASNLKSLRRVALTRLRAELRDAARLDAGALSAAGVQALMTFPNGRFHLLVGLPGDANKDVPRP
ncbi:hypothetical protein D9M69_449220 [compost metagenome]